MTTAAPTRLAFVALLAMLGLSLVHAYPLKEPAPWYSQKWRAANLADRALRCLQLEQRGMRRSGLLQGENLIGPKTSSITSDRGYLAAKQVALDPNFAALLVEWLRLAGARRGDVIGVALTGSFPALNVCVLAALKELELVPAIVMSASASNWGANDPNFSWLDMEYLLCQRGFFFNRSQLVSIGGDGDCGGGMALDGVALLKQKIKNRKFTFLNCQNTQQSIQKRMEFYQKCSRKAPLKAYINVGGNVASISRREKRLFRPGLNLKCPTSSEPLHDSVAVRMSRAKIPVIHLVQVRRLAAEYSLQSPPEGAIIGKASVYFNCRYSSKLAGGVLAALFFSLRFLVQTKPFGDQRDESAEVAAGISQKRSVC